MTERFRSVFLETSVQKYKIFSTGRVRKEINRIIADCHAVTSTYVLGEFLKSIIAPLLTVYTAIADPDNQNLSDIQAYLSHGYGRVPGKHAAVLSLITQNRDYLPKRKLLATARRFLRGQLMVHFRKNIDEVIDATECALAKCKIVEVEGRYEVSPPLRCRKNEERCGVVVFIQENIDILRTIRSSIEGMTEHSDLCGACTTILSDPRKALGRICKDIAGDVIIALECPRDSVLLTGDKVFGIICPAIRKEFKIVSGK